MHRCMTVKGAGMMKAERNQGISLLKIYRKLFPILLSTFPLFFILVNLIGLLHGSSFALITFTSQHFFDAVAEAVNLQISLSIVWLLGGALGAVTIGSEILNGLHNFIANTYIKKITGVLNLYLHDKAGRIDPIAYESPHLLDDINKAGEGMHNSLSLLFTSITIVTFYVPFFIIMGIYLYYLKPILALSIVLIFVPVALIQLLRGTVFSKLEDESAPIRREYDYYERTITDREYYKETRILGAFDFFNKMYQSSLQLLGQKIWQAEYRMGLVELLMKMLTLSGYGGVLYLLFDALLKGQVSIGAFAAVFASVGLMFTVMDELVAVQIGRMTQNIGTVRNFIRFLDLPETSGEDQMVDAGNGVVLDRVSFRYPGAEVYALTNVSLTLNKGETIAIVGENGAGKSTLVKLMMGLYVPSEGTVYIDGIDSQQIARAHIYRGISAVFQRFQKYQMKLDDNIKMSDYSLHESAEQKEQQLAIAAAKADIDVHQDVFPDGYETILSREFDGVDLSGGQWQRVAIARGFYRSHELIVLDEPTAAIDPLEETRIYEQFMKITDNKTAIIVTHRLGSAQIADRIIVLDQGEVVENGTHEQLLQAGGKYEQMFRAQAQWYTQS